MKIIFIAVLSAFFLSAVKAQEPSHSPWHPESLTRVAEYGNLRFSDEKALLDALASELRKAPDRVIYLLTYSDWQILSEPR